MEKARPGEPVLSNPVLDLLRLPLLLSIHVLSGANASATGELLRQFHNHLARHLPEGFTEVLAGAVAASALANDRSYGRLVLTCAGPLFVNVSMPRGPVPLVLGVRVRQQ
jgi:hypothetical protein